MRDPFLACNSRGYTSGSWNQRVKAFHCPCRRAVKVLPVVLLSLCWLPLWYGQHDELQSLRIAVSRLRPPRSNHPESFPHSDATQIQALYGINNLPVNPNSTNDPHDDIERLQAELNMTNAQLLALGQRVDDLSDNLRSSMDDVYFKLGQAAAQRVVLGMLLNRTSSRLSSDEVELHIQSLDLQQLATNVTDVQFDLRRVDTEYRNEAVQVSALATNISRVSRTLNNVSSTGASNLAARVANVSSRLDHVQSVDASAFAAVDARRKAFAGKLANLTSEVQGVHGLNSRVENILVELRGAELQERVDAQSALRGRSALQVALDNETNVEQADADVARQQRDVMSHRVDVVSANLADSIQQTSVTDAQSSDDREALSHRIDDLAAESGEVNEGQVECQWEDYGFCTCHGWVSMGKGLYWSAWHRVDGQIRCSTEVFGDACPGCAKVCICRA